VSCSVEEGRVELLICSRGEHGSGFQASSLVLLVQVAYVCYVCLYSSVSVR